MRFFSYSLSKTLWSAISISTSMVALAVLSVVVAAFIQRLEGRFHDYTERTAKQVQKVLTPALRTMDMVTAEAVMESLSADPRIAVLELTSVEGERLYLFDKGAPLFTESKVAVVIGEQTLGHFRIGIDDGVRRAAVTDVIVVAIVIAAVVILVQGFILVHVLRGLLARPLRHLGRAVSCYANGEFFFSDDKPIYDEFKPLLEALRHMGGELQHHVSQLKKNEAKYRSFFQNTPVGVLRSTFRGRLIEANPAAVVIFGASSLDELLEWGRDFPGNALVYPEQRGQHLQDLSNSPDGWSVDVQLRRLDGTVFSARVTAALSEDANTGEAVVHSILEDVTERQEAAAKVVQSEKKFSMLFRAAPFPISLATFPVRRFVDVNDAFLELSGYSYSEIIGKTPAEMGVMIDPESAARLVELCKNEGGLSDIRCEMRTKSGDLRTLSITAQVFELGQEQFVIIISRDVTSELKMQEMMIQSEKMISIGGIAAGVAHEINNPLGIIVQSAQMMELRLDPLMERNLRVAEELGVNLNVVHAYAEKRGILEFAEQIRAASLRASSIIRNMLDFSRTSSKNRVLCSVPSIVDKSLELSRKDYDLQRSFDFRKIAITHTVEGDLPSIVCVETEIEQVLINLFRNAAQAMASATPPLEDPQIEIVSRRENGYVVIEVADNGPGMPREVCRRVFEPFFTTKPAGKGTGLGLSVSYFIITRGHSGQMEVHSEPGQGTMFVIKLPLGPLPSRDVVADL